MNPIRSLFRKEKTGTGLQNTPSILVNSYATLTQPPLPDFRRRSIGQRDRADPELLPHLQGFAGYVFNPAQRQPTHLHWALLEHALRTRHHFSFEVEETDFHALSDWAVHANAILFLPDGTVRDPQLRVLFNPADGASAPEAELPYPADALARRTHSQAIARQLYALSSPESLPPVIGTGEAVFRSAETIAARASALMAIALIGEGHNNNDPAPPEHLFERLPLAPSAMTPWERNFFQNPRPDAQSVTNAIWRYEALTTLLWSLGLVETLPPESSICDVPAVARLMLEHGKTLATAQLRPAADILDALDLVYRLHWSTIDARQKGIEMTAVIPGVIAERHYALNWLVAYHDADWDDVQTPT